MPLARLVFYQYANAMCTVSVYQCVRPVWDSSGQYVYHPVYGECLSVCVRLVHS